MSPGSYLMRCANKACEARRRTTQNPLRDGWPEHCGERMVFATTFDEDRFFTEALKSGSIKFDLEDVVKLVDS